ncbi:universal stress protein [Microbacterium sp. B2969]|uniref:Universal stress protein n=1 Tax=Microbacterium alkaliflavum TaxID=3248839 RepID=A0ABW7Q5S6_9MICO
MAAAESEAVGEAPEPLQPRARPGLLVGVDGSRESFDALAVAVDMAPKLNLPLHALVVWDLATTLYDDYFTPDAVSQPRDDASRVVRVIRKTFFPTGEPPWFTVGTERGRPAAVLLRHSAECEILVVGRRGHGGFTGLLLGSVSGACVSHSKCPVLVVP